MNERRRFLRMLGGAVTACGAACSAGSAENSGGGAAGGAPSTGAASAGSGGSLGTSSSTGDTCGGGGASTAGKNTDACKTNAGVFAVGTPTDFASNGLHTVANDAANVLVGRDAGGLYAMSSLCTHQCCDLDNHSLGQLSTSGVRCLCHNSQYDAVGNVVTGPAKDPLAHHPLSLGCDGTLYVDTTKSVASSTRLSVA